MESVRPAGSADSRRILDLVTEMLDGLSGIRGGPELLRLEFPEGNRAEETALEADVVPLATVLAGAWMADTPERMVFVGEFEGVTMGLAAASIDLSASKGKIECCYVEPAARGVGVGSELMAAMLRWFKDCGCVDIDAPALPGDRASKQLFEAGGFKARLLLLHRRLD